jgi:hypothetical protein
MRTALLLLLPFAVACSSSASKTTSTPVADAGPASADPGDAGDPNGPWSVDPITVDGLPPLWGAITAEEGPTVAYLAGGVTGDSGPVVGKVYKVEQGNDKVTVSTITSQLTPRFCGCAMVDPGRKKLLVFGGRDGDFAETNIAEIVDLVSGAVTPIDAGDATSTPVGCHAVFLADRDEGYVFGGGSEAKGFGGTTFRYTPADGQLTALDGAGPPARYDGVFRYPAQGGPVWLLAGMGASATGVRFYQDVWQFDPKKGTWSEVPVHGDAPHGRRFPWVTFNADQSAIVMGYGSTSPMGDTMIGDFWRFDVAPGTWTKLALAGADQPNPRGFASWLPGPSGAAGVVSGGLANKSAAIKETVVIHPPVTGGGWH